MIDGQPRGTAGATVADAAPDATVIHHINEDLSVRHRPDYGASMSSVRTALRWGGMAVTLALLFATVAVAKAPPVRKMDRMWAVGAPVLEEGADRGVYVWVEDGALQLAAWPGTKNKKSTFRLRIEGTRALSLSGLGDFKVVSKLPNGVIVEVTRRSRMARGKVVCKGDLTISEVTRGARRETLFVGPLAKRAAKLVTIGRF